MKLILALIFAVVTLAPVEASAHDTRTRARKAQTQKKEARKTTRARRVRNDRQPPYDSRFQQNRHGHQHNERNRRYHERRRKQEERNWRYQQQRSYQEVRYYWDDCAQAWLPYYPPPPPPPPPPRRVWQWQWQVRVL